MPSEVTATTHASLTPYEQVREDLRHLSGDDKASKQAALHLSIIAGMYQHSDFLFVGVGDEPFTDSRRLYARLSSSPIYIPLDRSALRRVILAAARSLPTPVVLTGSQVKQVLETFQDRPINLANIERRLFYVSRDLFFNLDAEEGQDQLVRGDELPDTAKCFFRLYDSSNTDKDIVSFPRDTFNSTFSEKVLSSYNSLLSDLEELAPNPEDPFPAASLSAMNQDGDPLPRHFKFIEDWANGNPGLYWDLLTIPATVFMKEKPTVSFFLSGSSMNGKSSYLGLLHTIFGSNNTTRVKLSDMDKWHLNTQLQYTLFNAPDDEGDTISPQSAEFFKSIASHGTISLPIMRSQVPMKLNADFMSAHPMNAFPDWGDSSSASALTRRTCLIPFTADFRGVPKVDNFAKKTFTPDVIAEFTGEVLALATFYSTHPLTWSNTTAGARQQVEAENDSIRLYKEHWEKYFNGFQNMKLLHDDYRCWCREQGYAEPKNMSAFKINWYAYTSNMGKATLTGVDYKPLADKKGRAIRKNAYMDPNRNAVDKSRKSQGLPPLITMLEDTRLPYKELSMYGSVASMHAMEDFDKATGRTSVSAVTLMERMEENGD